MNPADRPGRLLALGVLMTVLWTAYACLGFLAFDLSGHSVVIGVGYLVAAVALGYPVVRVWRQYAAVQRRRQTWRPK
jgi:hypothetical protein